MSTHETEDSANHAEQDSHTDSYLASEQELLERLTPLQYEVTQNKGTERPGTGEYWRFSKDGTYVCIVCGQKLFESTSKFPTDCGWPGFDRATRGEAIEEETDDSHGMIRTEVTCSRCGAHLGHVFNDGPTETGLRYCINSASLDFHDAPASSPPAETAGDKGTDSSAPSDLNQ